MALQPTTGWDETTPPGSETEALGDDHFRTLKQQIRELAAVEHDWPSSGQATGRHQIPSVAESAVGSIANTAADMIACTTDTKALFQLQSGTWELIGGVPMMKGTRAAQPAAGNDGRVYWVSDEGVVERDNGTIWELIFFINNVTGGKSVVFHDHFQSAIYALDGSDNAVEKDWTVEISGTQPSPDSEYAPELTTANGVIRGTIALSTDASVMSTGVATALAQNPVMLARLKFSETDDCEMRWGLANTWAGLNGADPTRGIFIRRKKNTAPTDVIEGVVEESTGETTVDLGTPDSNWHDYKAKVTGGDNVEFFIDGTSKGSVTTVTLTEMLRVGGNAEESGGGGGCSYDIDYTTILSDDI